MTDAVSPGRGRRPGAPDTRGAILAAARERFADVGYDRTTIRGVAAEAGVDPALVYHYFGAKEDLFVAAMELPIDPREVAPQILGGGLDGAGERLARLFVTVWEDPDKRAPLLALLRSGFAGDAGRSLVRGGMIGLILHTVQEYLGDDEGPLRGELVMTQLLGVAVGRYVLEVEPLASMPSDELVAWLAPTLQRYLTGKRDDLP